MQFKQSLMAAAAAMGLGIGVAGVAAAEVDPFLGEIRPVGMNWCPRGWTPLNGQLLPINTNQALFSLLGCTYGGDCRTSFAIPEMRGRAMVGQGSQPGLSSYAWGQRIGSQQTTLTTANLPRHNHMIAASSNDPERASPSGAGIPTIPNPANEIYTDAAPAASGALRQGTIGNAGGNQSIYLSQPSIAVNYCMAVQGTFPSRN